MATNQGEAKGACLKIGLLPIFRSQLQRLRETVSRVPRYQLSDINCYENSKASIHYHKGVTESLIRTETKQKASEVLKTALTSAPALELPDESKPFHLFVHETKDKKGFSSNFETMEILCDHLPKWLDYRHRMACLSNSWEYQNAAYLMTMWPRSTTKPYTWPTLKSSLRNSPSLF